MNKTVLLFNFSPERARDIRAALRPLGCTARAAAKKEQKKTVGELLGLPAAVTSEQQFAEFDREFILIYGFSGVGLELALKVLASAGAGRGTLKALVTETNVNWRCTQLFDEVLREHLALEGNR